MDMIPLIMSGENKSDGIYSIIKEETKRYNKL